MMKLDDITQQVQDLGVAYVTVTGGEPWLSPMP